MLYVAHGFFGTIAFETKHIMIIMEKIHNIALRMYYSIPQTCIIGYNLVYVKVQR